MSERRAAYNEVERVVYEILDEVISPVCDIEKGTIWADPFLADISCYTGDDEDLANKVIQGIADRFSVPVEDFDTVKDSNLVTIALMVCAGQ